MPLCISAISSKPLDSFRLRVCENFPNDTLTYTHTHTHMAHAILTDPLERRIYDKLGEEGVQRWRE